MVSSAKTIWFIINPNSGIGKSQLVSLILKDFLNLTQINYQVFKTQFKGHAQQIAQEAIDNSIDVIVAIGGDGTINEISKVIVNTNIALGIIPAGSGNGLARFLKIPFNLHTAIKIINNHKIKIIDTLDINGELAVSISGIGFDAMIADKFKHTKVRGLLSYIYYSFTTFLKYKPETYHLSINNDFREVEALFIAFANSNQFGSNIVISPHAVINDGLFEVCIFKKPSVPKLIRIAPKFFRKTIDKSSIITIVQSNQVMIQRKGKTLINIDGEAKIVNGDINIKILPNSLRIIVP